MVACPAVRGSKLRTEFPGRCDEPPLARLSRSCRGMPGQLLALLAVRDVVPPLVRNALFHHGVATFAQAVGGLSVLGCGAVFRVAESNRAKWTVER